MKRKMDPPVRTHPGRPCHVIGMVASAGGVSALGTILSRLPGHFPAPLLVVQHMPAHVRSHLAEVLGRRTELGVKEAEEGDHLHAGWVFIAPPDRHVVVNPDDTLSLSRTGRVRHVRPSGDVLFASMAVSCKERAIGVVLTGGDEDGATGAKLVKAMGGVVIAQDEASSECPCMPRAAAATGAADYVLPLDQIATHLGYLVHHGCGRGMGESRLNPTQGKRGPGGGGKANGRGATKKLVPKT